MDKFSGYGPKMTVLCCRWEVLRYWTFWIRGSRIFQLMTVGALLTLVGSGQDRGLAHGDCKG